MNRLATENQHLSGTVHLLNAQIAVLQMYNQQLQLLVQSQMGQNPFSQKFIQKIQKKLQKTEQKIQKEISPQFPFSFSTFNLVDNDFEVLETPDLSSDESPRSPSDSSLDFSLDFSGGEGDRSTPVSYELFLTFITEQISLAASGNTRYAHKNFFWKLFHVITA